MFKLIITIFSFSACFISVCKAQPDNYIFKHLTMADGLISNKVCALFQDKEGFMWIGTQTGLQRYDGKRFKNYVADIRDTAALQSDWISSIFEDSKNRLWFGCDLEGPYVLNRTNNKFYNYNLHASAGNKIKGIWNIAEDKQGIIWVAGHDALYRLNEATNSFENYNAALGINKRDKLSWFTVDNVGNFWIGSAMGIKFYDRKEKKLYDHNSNPQHIPVFDIEESIGVIIVSDGNVWFTGSKKIFKYNIAEKKVEQFTFDKLPSHTLTPNIDKEIVGNIISLKDGKILVSLVGRGLAIYRPEFNKFFIVEADNGKSYTYHIAENSYGNVCAFRDRGGSILIGSDKGLNIFSPGKQYFQIHERNESQGNYFPARAAASDFLELEDGNMLISFYNINGGVIKTDSLFHFKKQYLFNDRGNKNVGVNQTWNLFKDRQNIIWAPNQMNSILKLNLRTEKMINEKDSILNGPIIRIKQDSGNIIWLAHWRRGLIKMNLLSGEKIGYKDFHQAQAADIRRVQCILPEKNIVWAGTSQNGLQVFDKNKELFTACFVSDITNPTAITSNCVTDIIAYNNDTLILATLMGVNIFDKKTKTFKAITAKDGLPNNLVQSVIKDNAGDVWIACFSEGLCKLNMHNFSITQYDINDGITDNEFTSNFYKLKNGQILLGASHSFVSFDPLKMIAEPLPADVIITGLYILEKERDIDYSKKNNEALQLNYTENALRIEFTSLEYWNPGAIKYYYKLEGADENWVLADESNTAVYNQLKEGKYIFNVKCANKEGVFSNKITQLKVTINPPFWKTWWFRTLLLLSLIALITAFIKGREKSIKTIAAEKLKVHELNAEQYKNKLKLEQIVNYFSSSLIDKNTVSAVLWDVAKNLIGQLGFTDCMIYTWNSDKTKMVQNAGFGPKDSIEEINKLPFDVLPGQGLVGYVMQTKEPLLIADTSKDDRYRPDDLVRLSEITVPIIYNKQLIGIIDSEHPQKNFYTQQHVQLLTTIATLTANKIKSIEADNVLQQTKIEMYKMNEQLSKAKLEALRSQMNPHFIFNSLNAIQECILTNNVDAAYEYLSKFSKLQRMVLNNSQLELIPLSSEIEMLQLYLSLESLRFSKSFYYSINTECHNALNEIMVPSLITQPIVENALWHGLRSKDGEKKLEIIYRETEEEIIVIIDDNGIGRIEAAYIKKKKLGSDSFTSKGTILLQQRLNVLSLQLKAEIKLITEDKKDMAGNSLGTKVTISFPSNLENAE